MCDAAVVGVVDSRIDHIDLSDDNIDPGADTYVCSETVGDIFGAVIIRRMDHGKLRGFFGTNV